MDADLIFQLETDLLNARRVADERLEMLSEEQRANKVLQERVDSLGEEIRKLKAKIYRKDNALQRAHAVISTFLDKTSETVWVKCCDPWQAKEEIEREL